MVTETENAFGQVVSKPDTAKYKVSESEGRSIETISMTHKKKNNVRK